MINGQKPLRKTHMRKQEEKKVDNKRESKQLKSQQK